MAKISGMRTKIGSLGSRFCPQSAWSLGSRPCPQSAWSLVGPRLFRRPGEEEVVEMMVDGGDVAVFVNGRKEEVRIWRDLTGGQQACKFTKEHKRFKRSVKGGKSG
jgi:hypothetical protein